MSALSFEQNRRETTTRLAALILANGFIFQERLAAIDERIKPIESLLSETNFIEATILHWKSITEEIVYVPILKMAYDILSTFPIRRDTETLVRNLAFTSSKIVLETVSIQHDLMAKLYHSSPFEDLHGKSHETSLPAATLLMKLTLDIDRWPHIDWSDERALESLRIADLACGTGVLLMAAVRALNDNYIRASISADKFDHTLSLVRVQQIIIEKIVHGFDVLHLAVHLAASRLALLAPEICSRKMQLYCLAIGKLSSGQIHFGSLDYMTTDSVSAQREFISPDIGGNISVMDDEADAKAVLPQLDLCVINPPNFWNKGNKQSSKTAEHSDVLVRTELSRRIRGAKLSASASAGPGGIFAAVADRHIKDGGRIALVLPAAATTDVGWERTRDLINNGYILEMLIASHDPNRLSFSEDTNVTEILLIAKKQDHRRDNPRANVLETPTKIVSLWVNPRTIAQASGVAEQILRLGSSFKMNTMPEQDISLDPVDIMIGSHKYGEMIELRSQNGNPARWIGSAFAQTNLVRVASMLRQGYVSLLKDRPPVSIPMTTIGAIGLLGPPPRDMSDTFARSASVTEYPTFCLRNADKVGTMESKPKEWLRPHTGTRVRKVRNASLIWRRAGPIMIPVRLQMDTQKVLALRLPGPALSQGWWPLRLREKNDRAEKALVLWLNSTLGIVTLLAHRVPTRGTWIQFKRQTIQNMPALDVTALSDPILERLAQTYDLIAPRELQKLSDLTYDALRFEIDTCFSQIFGLAGIDDIRAQLAREPMICLKPCSQHTDTDNTDDRLEFALL